MTECGAVKLCDLGLALDMRVDVPVSKVRNLAPSQISFKLVAKAAAASAAGSLAAPSSKCRLAQSLPRCSAATGRNPGIHGAGDCPAAQRPP